MSQPGMPSSFDDVSEFYEETRWQKFKRKVKQEPLIPFGTLLTCYALYRASRSIKSGDHNQTQRMFRARIYAQFFTICCMIGGSYYYAEERQKRKVFESAIVEKQQMDRREKWIKELEARDEEDKALKAQQQAKAAAKAAIKVQPPASSALEESEKRRVGVLEAVKQLRGFGR